MVEVDGHSPREMGWSRGRELCNTERSGTPARDHKGRESSTNESTITLRRWKKKQPKRKGSLKKS
eukprot:12912078-Prorocentrum_lima.AAC.1